MMRLISITLLALLLSSTAMADEMFLEAHEVALLKQDPQVAGLKNYMAAGKQPSNYDKIAIGSITFFFAEDSKTKDIDAKEMKQISDELQAAMEAEFSQHYQVVTEPGENTLLVNLAVTKIKMKNKKRGLLGYTPIGLVTTTAGNLAGARLILASASLQGESVDSVTGDMVTMFEVKGVKNLDEKKNLSWEDVRLTIAEYAELVMKARFGG